MSGGIVRERYSPVPLAANGTYTTNSKDSLGGFLCITAGTLTATRNDDVGTITTIINAFPVAAGIYYPLPFYLGKSGGTVVLAGGASGTLGV